MATRGFLGIDAGTQGLSVVLTDESMNVIATGEGSYSMCPGLDEGCYEQAPADWVAALQTAMSDLRANLKTVGGVDATPNVLAIGISGQMHGEVLVDDHHQAIKPARLWCDARNEREEVELTQALGAKMPKRITAARWLWTLRNQPDVAAQTCRLTTPGGWIAFCLTGEFNLGVGDAAGMFPIDQASMTYDTSLLSVFDSIAQEAGASRSLNEMLPEVRVAGQAGGQLTEQGAQLLQLPVGIPVAPAEGDQPASLAGSLIAEAGMVSVSFGTSVCANSVGDQRFEGVSQAVDHFCAPDGKPINMVWLRNGTTFMNTVVQMFGRMRTGDESESGGQADDPFAQLMPRVARATPECGGMLALPFMDDEPGLGITEGGMAMLHGIHQNNATPENAVKAALLATMFNLKMGCEVLDRQGFPRSELVLSGGLTRTPELGQVLADVMNTRVTLFAGADEGCAWGAALMAKFRWQSIDGTPQAWEPFLAEHAKTMKASAQRFEPIPDHIERYASVYQRYQRLLQQLNLLESTAPAPH